MLERLIQLEKNIAQLEAMKLEHSKTEFSASTQSQWALRYGLIESIQIVIDTACAICNKNNLGTPKNYADCLRLLSEFRYVDEKLSKTLIKIVGLRNLLIHEYTTIDNKRLYDFLSELDVFRDYARSVGRYL